MLIKLLGTALIAISFAAAGCSTINPYTGEQQTSKVVKGSAIGAAAGAAVGLIAGHDAKSRRKYAAIGVAAGAATGGGVGYYMDVQEAKLRQELESTGVSVVRDGDNIVLVMPGNITFATDSSSVSSDAIAVLNSVSKVLKKYEKTAIVVAGYTDSTGSASHNMLLSKQRAQSVANILMERNVEYGRLHVKGFGIQNPVASNATASGRAQNRRVELTLVPTE